MSESYKMTIAAKCALYEAILIGMENTGLTAVDSLT